MRTLLMIAILLVTMTKTVHADTIKATINGLVCAFCATGIEKTFKAQSAVEDVKVDLETRLVTIRPKKDQGLDDATVTRLIEDAGYSVTDIKREKE